MILFIKKLQLQTRIHIGRKQDFYTLIQMYITERNMAELIQPVTKHRYNLKSRFEIVRSLGSGTYGKVKLAIDKKTGLKVRQHNNLMVQISCKISSKISAIEPCSPSFPIAH